MTQPVEKWDLSRAARGAAWRILAPMNPAHRVGAGRVRARLFVWLAVVSASCATLGAAPRASTTPIEGLRDASPRTHALVGARLVVAPGQAIERGTVVVRDGVIVALGATAVRAVLGRSAPIGATRGQAIQLPDQAQAVVTWHPSYLLRVPDEAAKARAFGEFVADLRYAWALVA